jgi:hypothetical protein
VANLPFHLTYYPHHSPKAFVQSALARKFRVRFNVYGQRRGRGAKNETTQNDVDSHLTPRIRAKTKLTIRSTPRGSAGIQLAHDAMWSSGRTATRVKTQTRFQIIENNLERAARRMTRLKAAAARDATRSAREPIGSHDREQSKSKTRVSLVHKYLDTSAQLKRLPIGRLAAIRPRYE